MTGGLFTVDDLSDYLHEQAVAESAVLAEQVVWGWLADATGLTERPDPVPPDLFAWALELGAMAYDNPTSLAVRTVDDVSLTANEERRNAILESASQASDLTNSGDPQGCFPCALPWPDPVGASGDYSVFGAGYTYGVGHIP